MQDENLFEKEDYEALCESERRWEELTITNRFIFAKVFSDPERCLKLVRLILPELDIQRIRFVEVEKTEENAIDSKAVRFDIFIRDNMDRGIEIEMQTVDTRELPRRSRYYSAEMDEALLGKGRQISYEKLPDSYTIFICLFDLFGKGLHKYTFSRRCEEDQGIALDDGQKIIFLSAGSFAEDIEEGLRSLLQYFHKGEATDEFTAEIDRAVGSAKKNRIWRREFMIYDMELRVEREHAEERGERRLLRRQILKKMQKGQSVERIADDLEEDIREVRKLYNELLKENEYAIPLAAGVLAEEAAEYHVDGSADSDV